ncbi:MAG: TIM barrel protein [Clostridiales bacterium]|nr:TIM barrel protein [Clostridiales bacterium]
MKKLMNFSVDPYDLDKFCHDSGRLAGFLEKHGLDGLEMFQYGNWDDSVVPNRMIIGSHTSFWPIWLDFWKGDTEALDRQFGSSEALEEYYRCRSRDELVENYRRELRKADALGAEYVLFHVSHTEIEHCYTYSYPYTDSMVIDAFVDMINSIMEGIDADFQLLFENHWYPGLTFRNNAVSKRLLEEINYPRKGFVLDIGHLMNTNTGLESEEAASVYILDTLCEMGELRRHIKVIHLNSSLSGEYVKESIKKNNLYDHSLSFNEKYVRLYGHIAKIDTHVPFRHPSIRKVIEYVNPEYLVYEFAASSLDMLDDFMKAQNLALGL